MQVGTSHYIDAPRWSVRQPRTLSIPTWDCNGHIRAEPRNMRITWGEDIVYTKAPTRTWLSPLRAPRDAITLDPNKYAGDYDITYRNLAAVLDGTELLVKAEEALRVMNRDYGGLLRIRPHRSGDSVRPVNRMRKERFP